jgi:hypothetical protein
MAVVRHFAIILIRHAPESTRQSKPNWPRNTAKPRNPKPTSLDFRQNLAGWNTDYLNTVLGASAR